MLLTYIDFKNKYPESKLSYNEYDVLYDYVYDYIKSYSCYKLDELSTEKKQQIINLLALQIYYFEKEDVINKGIVSQSILSTSISINNNKQAGAVNWSDLFIEGLKRTGIGMRF